MVLLSRLSDPWFLAVIAWAVAGYKLFPEEHQYAAFGSGQGLTIAVLCWFLREKRWGVRWWVAMFGVEEGLQVFACQLLQIWKPIPGPQGMCSAYTELPLFWFGAWALLLLALAVDSYGHRKNG